MEDDFSGELRRTSSHGGMPRARQIAEWVRAALMNRRLEARVIGEDGFLRGFLMQFLELEHGDLPGRPRVPAEDVDDHWRLSVGGDTLKPQFRPEVAVQRRSAVAQRDR